MKNLNLKLVLIAALVVVVGVGIVLFNGNTPDEPGMLGSGVTLDSYTVSGQTATTTNVYQAVGASRQMILSTSNAQHIDLNMMVNSTSTATVLNYYVYFSNDDGANKNWYGQDAVSVSGVTATHASTTIANYWKPNATGPQYKNVGIDPVASKYMKVVFTITGAKALTFYQAVTQQATN